MLLLNRVGFRGPSQLLLLLAVFTLLVSGNASAQTFHQQSNQVSVTKVQKQLKETTVSEGRNAVEFYRGQAVTNDEASRLSDKFVQYPVNPVERLRAIGKHHVLRLDSFVAAQEGNGPSYGLRTEWIIEF